MRANTHLIIDYTLSLNKKLYKSLSQENLIITYLMWTRNTFGYLYNMKKANAINFG